MDKPNILQINTISGDWCDKDIIMLHACFQLLTDCIEDEHLLTGHIDWTHDAGHINAEKEINELYNWWLERKKIDNDLDKEQFQKDNILLIRLINIRQFLCT